MEEREGAHSVPSLSTAAVVTNSGLLQGMPSSPDGQGKNKLFSGSSWSWFGPDLDSQALVAIVWQEPPSSPAFPEGLSYY